MSTEEAPRLPTMTRVPLPSLCHHVGVQCAPVPSHRNPAAAPSRSAIISPKTRRGRPESPPPPVSVTRAGAAILGRPRTARSLIRGGLLRKPSALHILSAGFAPHAAPCPRPRLPLVISGALNRCCRHTNQTDNFLLMQLSDGTRQCGRREFLKGRRCPRRMKCDGGTGGCRSEQ